MRHLMMIACPFLTFSVCPGLLQAQPDPLPLAPLPGLFAEAEFAAAADIHDARDDGQRPTPTRDHWHRRQLFASANRHPLTPRDVEMREAVRKLGIHEHRFLRCKLPDGSTVVGGIATTLGKASRSSRGSGAANIFRMPLWRLHLRADAAPAEHLANGLKSTGVVAVCVIAVPVAIVMMPLMFTRVIAG